MGEGATTRSWRGRILAPLLLMLAASALVLFPFDWLEEVWPAYGALFDVVFATPLAHLVGHATLFLIAAVVVLAAAPGLLRHPWRYALLGATGALAEEGLQSLAKLKWPVLGDGRDLLMDAIGLALAFFLMRLIAGRLIARHGARLSGATGGATATIKRGL